MLRSLPCERIVAAISYGCIGRSVSVTRTASASRFETARRPAISHLPTLVHPATYIRKRVYGHVYPPASNRSGGRTAGPVGLAAWTAGAFGLTAWGGWDGDPVGRPCGGACRAPRGR